MILINFIYIVGSKLKNIIKLMTDLILETILG